MNGSDQENEEDWAYGDVWKQVPPENETPDDDIEYVEVLRGDTGMGLDDTVMLDYVFYLGQQGIRATFESFPLEQIKIYVLRAEADRAEDAVRLLAARRK